MRWIQGFFAALILTVSFGPLEMVFAGQEIAVDTLEDLKKSALVAVIDVKEVTRVDVAGVHNAMDTKTSVFVAKAELVETIKSDHFPAPKNRTVVVIGSTLPRTTAVWRPIEKGRYLAFLKKEQGHYSYKYNMSFQKVPEGGKIRWGEYSENRFVASTLSLEEAVKRLQAAVPSN